MLWLILTVLLIPLLVICYCKLKKPLQYWEEKGIPYVKPWIFVGNTGPVIFRTKTMAHVIQDAYNQFRNHRYFGFYTFSKPTLVINDPDLIKQICIKDFDKFTDHTDFLPETSDPFWKKTLFAREGKDWHDMRTVLSPAFTGSKMRSMFCLMVECAEEFVAHFQKQSGTITLEMRDTFTRFTNDAIASCAFGIKCDSLKQRDNEFYLMGKDAFDFSGFKALKFFGNSISPTLMKLFGVSMFDEKMKAFFRAIVKDTIRLREEKGIVRPDMIHLLRQAQKGLLRNEDEPLAPDSTFTNFQGFESEKFKNSKRPEITDEDITVQAVLFFFGGYDTVALLLCNLAYELAIHFDVQEKLIEEVDDTFKRCNGKITYETVLGMKYLDMVISEALRLWPPAIFLNRMCVKPFTIAPVLPGEKPFHVDVGTDVMIPAFAIQRDPGYFSNPDKFDPERFSDENKNNIPPFSYLPFGTGPRLCIGNRFALLETKTVIFFLLTRFEIVPVKETSPSLVLSASSVLPRNEKGYWLGLKPRTQVS